MKSWLCIILSLLFSLPIMARRKDSVVTITNGDSLPIVSTDSPKDSHKAAKGKSVLKSKNSIYSWNYKGHLATKQNAGIDTSMNEFYVNHPALKKTIAIQSLGNLGSPTQSAIFADRINKTDFIFFQPYQIYYRPTDEILYFNTKRPFSYINYYSGGTSNRDNRRLNGVFTVNANKKLNFGMYGDWTKAYGAYPSLSTKNYNAGFFTSYDGFHSQFGAAISFNGYESYENGGFMSDKVITDPKNTGDMDPQTMQVYFTDNVWTKVRNWNASFNYRYNIGIEKEVQVTKDSTALELIPVTSFIYTFNSESDWRRLYERSIPRGGGIDSFFRSYNRSDSVHFNPVSTTDSSRYWQMKHTLGISLNEEFNTLMKFGFSAYFVAKTKKYTYLDEHRSINSGEVTPHNDSLGYTINPIYSTTYRNKLGVGAILSKNQGEAITYKLYGEYYFLDEKKTASSLELGAQLNSKAQWGKQPVEIGANAKFERYCPDFFEEYYYSNHIKWDKNFENKQDLIINGHLNLPSFAFYDGLGLSISADFRNLHNYVYWNRIAEPEQYTNNLQILTLSLKENARIWRIHWDNELTFQQSSNQDVLPLPKLCWYSTAYMKFEKLFKLLNLQFGVDMRWNSSYHAPHYMPATGQFFVQDPESKDYIEYGDYLHMNAYINIQLKNLRFYVLYNHFNSLWARKYNYLYTRGYAMDPDYVKFGLSVTLGD